jgi:hypothetical protein
MNLQNFVELSGSQKWRKSLPLFIGLSLSSLIHSVLIRISFQNTRSAVIISTVILVLSVIVFVLIFRRLKTETGRHWSIDSNSLTQNSQWIGFLLFGVCLLVGPIVTFYIVISYLAVAPLFVDNQNTIRLDSLFVATTFGVLVAGLIYVLSADIGLVGELTVPIVFLSLAVINIINWNDIIVPRIVGSNYVTLGILLTLFFAYSGTVLVGSFMMGLGEYPGVFFNVDTPLRLTHAHEILGLTDYPPKTLTTSGIYRSYHYGGPAAASTITAITGVALHKSMFWVAIPLLLVGSFSVFCLISRSILKKAIFRYLAIILFLPFVRLGGHVYYWFVYNTQAYGVYEMLLTIMKGFIPLNNYGAEEFGGGVWDISKTAGIFLLLISAFLLVKRQTIHTVILAPVVVLLTFFVKIALIPAVSALVGVRLLNSWKEYSLAKQCWYLVGCGVLTLSVLYLFGTFEAVGNSVVIRNVPQVLAMYSGNKAADWVLIEQVFLIGFSILFLGLYRSSLEMYDSKGALLLVLGTLTSLSICFLVISFMQVVKVWGAPYKVSWVAIPLLSCALLATAERSKYHKIAVSVVIVPVLLIAVMGQWHKIQQLAVTLILPNRGHEYTNNRELGEALATIPRPQCGLSGHDDCYGDYVRSYPDLQAAYIATGSKQSIEEWGQKHWGNYGKLENRSLKKKNVIVTNDFQYLWVKNHQTPITGLMGHQAYAVDAYWLQHDRTLIQVANRRINLQKNTLSSLFNRVRPQFSSEVISLAKQLGWTHYLFNKKDMGRTFRSPSITYGKHKNNDMTNRKLEQSSKNNLASPDPPLIVLRRISNTQQDRVSCNRGGLKPDGIMDNVFVADVTIPINQISLQPKIIMIETFRDNPSGRNHTNNHSHALGVSLGLHTNLVNASKGSVRIPVSKSQSRFWLFSCSDGHDRPHSRYFARLTFSLPLKISEYDNAADIPLRKLFENNKFAVYKF